MQRLFVTIAAFTLAFASLQAQAPTLSRPPAANPISDSLRGAWNSVKGNIKESADLMPPADYRFKPTPKVRSFGEILAHVAGASYVFCAAAKGEKTPFAEDYFEKRATTKAEIVKATNDAIAYCDGAFQALTDTMAGQMVNAPFGSGLVPRTNPLVGQIGHDQEHYGNLVTYFRLKGLVPPSSRRQ
jgi:uncharacterized damage-inducible protein DinB